MKKLSELFRRLTQYIIHGERDATIYSITDDSRCVQSGSLFVAVKGVSMDGHHFIDAAIGAGAVAVVGELPLERVPIQNRCIYIRVPNSRETLGMLHASWYGFPSDSLDLIGVTGTDGKTTTTNLIYSILTASDVHAGMVSTVNARVGEKSYETGLHTTTPPAEDIQKYLAQMVAAGSTYAVLETTSHGWAQYRLSGCEFDTAVITNVTHEHLDYHGTWEAYMASKARLFEDINKPTRKNTPREKVAVVNLDDRASYDYLTAQQYNLLVSYSALSRDAEVYAVNVHQTSDNLSFHLESPWASGMIHSSLVGNYNVSNILAAAAACLANGFSMDAVITGVAGVKGVAGRMERLSMGQDFLAVVDFAHTPNALRRTLEASRELVGSNNRIIVVFGCAGLRDKDKRWMMGEIAAQLADHIVVTAEDPRTESLHDIMTDIEKGLIKVHRQPGIDYWLIDDRGEAIFHAVSIAKKGDIVLACGKGHEQSMCFGSTEYPWDDREAMSAALQGKILSTLPTSQT